VTTTPGPAAWLDQATTHLAARRWDVLVRLCEDPTLPADAAAAAGLLGATAAAYLGQERRVPPHVSRALDAGAERLVLMQGLLAAAHAHVGAANRPCMRTSRSAPRAKRSRRMPPSTPSARPWR